MLKKRYRDNFHKNTIIKLSNKYGVTQNEVVKCINQAYESIHKWLNEGHDILLPRFASLVVRDISVTTSIRREADKYREGKIQKDVFYERTMNLIRHKYRRV